MSGTLEINPGHAWMPAGWAFDLALESIADALEAEDGALAVQLRQGCTAHGAGFVDLAPLDAVRYQRFILATQWALVKWRQRGSRSFHKPNAHAPFLASMEELLEMLRQDPRGGGA